MQSHRCVNNALILIMHSETNEKLPYINIYIYNETLACDDSQPIETLGEWKPMFYEEATLRITLFQTHQNRRGKIDVARAKIDVPKSTWQGRKATSFSRFKNSEFFIRLHKIDVPKTNFSTRQASRIFSRPLAG